MRKIYEAETNRSNITPKAFFNHCKKLLEKNGGNIEDWTSFEDWACPIYTEEHHTNKHEDWEVPKREENKSLPYDMQVYLQHSYNFILTFDFDTETHGNGYLYAVEFDR